MILVKNSQMEVKDTEDGGRWRTNRSDERMRRTRGDLSTPFSLKKECFLSATLVSSTHHNIIGSYHTSHDMARFSTSPIIIIMSLLFYISIMFSHIHPLCTSMTYRWTFLPVLPVSQHIVIPVLINVTCYIK